PSPVNEGFVDTIFLGALLRRVFETVGLYDPGAIANDDAELSQRIHDAGSKVYLSREIVVHYHPHDSFRAHGRGRARKLLKHGRLLSIRPLLPAALVAGGAALLATSFIQPFTPLAFGADGAHVRRGGARRPRRRGRDGLGHLPGPPRRARRRL